MDPVVQAVIEGVEIGIVVAPICVGLVYGGLTLLDKVMPRPAWDLEEIDESKESE